MRKHFPGGEQQGVFAHRSVRSCQVESLLCHSLPTAKPLTTESRGLSQHKGPCGWCLRMPQSVSTVVPNFSAPKIWQVSVRPAGCLSPESFVPGTHRRGEQGQLAATAGFGRVLHWSPVGIPRKSTLARWNPPEKTSPSQMARFSKPKFPTRNRPQPTPRDPGYSTTEGGPETRSVPGNSAVRLPSWRILWSEDPEFPAPGGCYRSLAPACSWMKSDRRSIPRSHSWMNSHRIGQTLAVEDPCG